MTISFASARRIAVTLAASATLAVAQTQSPASSPSSPFANARYVQVAGAGGVPLNVVEQGHPELPAVLFVHGFRQSHLSWGAQFASDLSQRCRLVAFDLRGHGNSGHPWQAQAYDSAQPWADDMARVIEALGLRQPLIVAWSFGGNVAMDFAALHPDTPVAGYLMVATAAGSTAAGGGGNMAAPNPPRPTASPDLTLNAAGVRASGDLLFRSPAITPALRVQFDAASMRVGPWVERGVQGRPRVDPTPPKTPMVVLTGGQDPIITPATLQRLTGLFPKARFIEFAASGHQPFLEEPARFHALLDELHCARP